MSSAGEGKASEFKWEDHGDLVKGEVEAGSKKEWSGSGSVSIKGKMGWLAVAAAVEEEEGKGEMSESSKGDLMSSLERGMLLLLLCS